jgi:hypothetical protein
MISTTIEVTPLRYSGPPVYLWMMLAATVALWIAVGVAHPRRPEGVSQELWLAWLRIENGWRLLLVCAVIASLSCAIALLIALAQGPNALLSSRRTPCSWESTYWQPSPPPGWWEEC